MNSPEIKITSSLLRWLYTSVLYLAVPFVVLRLLFKSISNPGYRDRLYERFGYVPAGDHIRPVLWIHAVSVGEVHAASPLVDQIMRTCPEYKIVISTMTPTGADTVKRLLGEQVRHVYVPYDLPDAVVRFLKRVKPAILIVMETEIWPNMFRACRKRAVPVVVVNGRLSQRSFSGYKTLLALTRMTLSDVTQVIAQTRADADRFVQLGMDQSRIDISGSLKFDVDLSDEIKDADQAYRREKLGQRPVWIAASTHAGEENIVIAAHQQLLKDFPDGLLIIAPRHPERALQAAEISRQAGLNTACKSQAQEINADIQVFIVDGLGVLPLFYRLSHIAFVGGSLVAVGGHNMLEPASLGVPVLMGPHVHNFSEIAAQLVESGGAWTVNNQEQLIQQVQSLLKNPAARQEAGRKLRDLMLRNRGTCERVMQSLRPLLSRYATSANKGI